MTTPLDIARNTVLAATTVAGMLREDPLLLVVQASRRLPRRLIAMVSRALLVGRAHGQVREVAGHWLGGHRGAATEAVRRARPRGPVARRLLYELAVELEAVPPSVLPAGRARARAAWRAGDLSGAVESARTAGAVRLAERLAAERATLDPMYAVPHGPAAESRTRAGGTPRAFHLLTNSLPHTSSGYALRSQALLHAQAAAGIEVVAATRLGYPMSIGRPLAPGCEVVDGIPYQRLLPWRMPATATARAVRSVELSRPIADRLGATVVHTTTPFGNGQIARALAAELGVPWVYEVRGLLEQTWVAARPGTGQQARAAASERFRLLRDQEAAVASSADRVITLSRTLQEDLAARGVPRERITVVPNGVDDRLLALPHREPADCRRDLGLPEQGFWVGTVSSLVGYEGLDTLIDAVALLRADGLDVRACLAGDGVARPELERRAHRAGVDDAVVFPGRVPAADAARWHRALDVFVVPRRDLEVCRRVTPLKPVEAMALGRPVVASDLPALAEVLAGGAGLLVAPDDAAALADALATLHADPARRASLAAAGRTVAAERTWRSQGLRYRQVYEQLAAEWALGSSAAPDGGRR